MDKSKIITEYWNLKEVNDAFKKMQPEELQEDLKAEVFLVLCEMDDDKIKGLYERNELKFYIVRIMLNMIKSDRSTFYKQYRNYTEFDLTHQKPDEVENTNYIDKLASKLEGLHWYNKEIIKLYAVDFKRNAKELSRKTGIPYMSIIRTLKKTKDELKLQIKQ